MIYKFDIKKKMLYINLFIVLHVYFSDRRIRERALEKLWRKNSGVMESFIMTLEVNNF